MATNEEAQEVASAKENSNVYLIQCDVTRIKGEKDGKKYDFFSYTAYDKRGKKSKIKFTKDAKNVPQEEGCYTLYIEKTQINRDKTTKYNEYWFKDVIKYEIYDGFTQDEEELPF
jgi:uncharacterized protein YxeA